MVVRLDFIAHEAVQPELVESRGLPGVSTINVGEYLGRFPIYLNRKIVPRLEAALLIDYLL